MSVPAVQLEHAVRTAANRLAEAGVDGARHDAEALAAHLLGVERWDLIRMPEAALDACAYEALVERRATREPLQHITGRAYFRHLDLAVGPGVFVPRPETETLVDWCLRALAGVENPLVVDLCTGSGAIALAIATELPGSRVHAVELDESALAWAARNTAGSEVVLHHGDAADALPELDGSVDLVVSNPPYIPLTEWEYVAPEARDHDPALALWAGEDGLEVVRAVERTARRLLKPGGSVGVEHSDRQGEQARNVFRDTGWWTMVIDHRDLAGRDRFVTAAKEGVR
jgi:release factor glutamine methyltransferase